MDVQKLLLDYNIPFITGGHKHSTEGWINIHCPFCPGSQDFHLGIHENGNGNHCWRCGAHTMLDLLVKLLGISEAEARSLFRKYKGDGIPRRKIEVKTAAIFPIKLPSPNGRLEGRYIDYLIKRGYDPKLLEEKWKIQQTGPISTLDGMSYKHRILIPIFWYGEMVSFQTRDITGKSPYKYLACPKNREKMHHKHILYGIQEDLERAKRIIVVEGVTDVWRLGSTSTATFGIEFKMEQVLKLAGLGDRFVIIFDKEPQAQKQARVLKVKLSALGKKVTIKQVPDDPGSMNQDDADYLVKQIQNGRR